MSSPETGSEHKRLHQVRIVGVGPGSMLGGCNTSLSFNIPEQCWPAELTCVGVTGWVFGTHTKQPLICRLALEEGQANLGAATVDKGGSTWPSLEHLSSLCPEGEWPSGKGMVEHFREGVLFVAVQEESDMAWEVSVTQGKWAQVLDWHRRSSREQAGHDVSEGGRWDPL